MIFANIEYLFLLLLLIPYIRVVRDAPQEDGTDHAGIYHTDVHAGSAQLEDLFAACAVCASYPDVCDDCAGTGTPANYR